MTPLVIALLIAGVFMGLGVFGASYFVYRIIMTLLIFRQTGGNPNDVAFLHRTIMGKKIKPPKEMPEASDIEISALADNPKAFENLRKQQDRTPPDNY